MTRLLHVVASPREGQSVSTAIGLAFIERWRQQEPDVVVDTLDLWREDLPAFDGDKAAAKLTLVTGGQHDARQQTAWEAVTTVASRFTQADAYLFSVPMWNGGVPYRLKHYIDLLMQPGILFRLDPVHGYQGLLQGKRAAAIYTSGVYQPGLPPGFGQDFHSTYLDWWLRTIGITQLACIRCQPTLRTADLQQVIDDALAQARRSAQRLTAG